MQKVININGSCKRTDPCNINGYWAEIEDHRALSKISQALREGAPTFKALHGQNKRKLDFSSDDQAPSALESVPFPELEPLPYYDVHMNDNGHELDWLLPFATTSGDNNGNDNLLGFRRDEAAEVIPPSPPIPKKQKLSVLARATTPELEVAPDAPPLLSPSPFGESKTAWDALVSTLSRGLPRVPSIESFSVSSCEDDDNDYRPRFERGFPLEDPLEGLAA